MYRLVYMSKAAHKMDDRELDQISTVARTNNAKIDVTGLLVYVGDTFFQVLEGPQPAVESVYNKVFEDDRHHRARILQQRVVTCRRFPDWTMGFCRLHETDENTEQFFELSRAGFESQIPEGASEDLVKLMHGFADAKLSAAEPEMFH